MNLNKKNLWKPTEPNKVKRLYWTAAGAAVLCLCCATPAMAAGSDPLDIVNNLSDFIFSIIKALGVIILGWGIVQVGMSIQSHDASQRTQGFLCLFGGLMIAFAKEILTTIGAEAFMNSSLRNVDLFGYEGLAETVTSALLAQTNTDALGFRYVTYRMVPERSRPFPTEHFIVGDRT